MTNDDLSPAEHDEGAAPLEPYAPGKVWTTRSQDSHPHDEAPAAEFRDEVQPVVIDDIDDADIEDIVGALPDEGSVASDGDFLSAEPPAVELPPAEFPAEDLPPAELPAGEVPAVEFASDSPHAETSGAESSGVESSGTDSSGNESSVAVTPEAVASEAGSPELADAVAMTGGEDADIVGEIPTSAPTDDEAPADQSVEAAPRVVDLPSDEAPAGEASPEGAPLMGSVANESWGADTPVEDLPATEESVDAAHVDDDGVAASSAQYADVADDRAEYDGTEYDNAEHEAAAQFAQPATDADEVPVHTTTIPVASSEDIAGYQPSATMPDDVLEARDMDNPPTSAIRRDLMSPQEHTEKPPAWEAALAASATTAASAPAVVHAQPTGETPESLSDAIFDGATVVPVVPSRTGAHLLSLFLGLILIPAAWFLFADASARMLFPADAPVLTGQPSWVALGEFGASIVLWVLFLLLTLRSSLGAWVWGVVLTLKGLPWLVAPGLTLTYVEPVLNWFSSNGGVVGHNFAHHVQLDGFSGRFLMMGLTLLAMAIIAVRVRRRGRAEEALRARVEKVNPEGAYLTARERRRARKDA